MTEGNGAATLTDSGALSFADLDTNDLVTVSQTYNNDIVWSGGTLSASLKAALIAGFSVDQDSWDYSTNQSLDFLRQARPSPSRSTWWRPTIPAPATPPRRRTSSPSPSPAPTTSRR